MAGLLVWPVVAIRSYAPRVIYTTTVVQSDYLTTVRNFSAVIDIYHSHLSYIDIYQSQVILITTYIQPTKHITTHSLVIAISTMLYYPYKPYKPITGYYSVLSIIWLVCLVIWPYCLSMALLWLSALSYGLLYIIAYTYTPTKKRPSLIAWALVLLFTYYMSITYSNPMPY